MSENSGYIIAVYFIRSSTYGPSCQVSPGAFVASVRIQVKSSVTHAKAKVGELSLVKHVMDRVNLVEFVMGGVR
jgi:hypothetical protein